MLFLRTLLLVVSFGFLAVAVAIVLYDLYLAFELNRILRLGEREPKDVAAEQAAGTRAEGGSLFIQAPGRLARAVQCRGRPLRTPRLLRRLRALRFICRHDLRGRGGRYVGLLLRSSWCLRRFRVCWARAFLWCRMGSRRCG